MRCPSKYNYDTDVDYYEAVEHWERMNEEDHSDEIYESRRDSRCNGDMEG